MAATPPIAQTNFGALPMNGVVLTGVANINVDELLQQTRQLLGGANGVNVIQQPFIHPGLFSSLPIEAEFSGYDKALILHYFPDTVFPDLSIFPQPPTCPILVQDLYDKYHFVMSIPRTADEFPMPPTESIGDEVEKKVNGKSPSVRRL